jgi:predicted acetyltransferase
VAHPAGEVGADGRFADYPLDPYWNRSGWSADLIRVGLEIAGFILINDQTHSGLPADRNVAETFILRKHRRQGIAQAAVRQTFDLVNAAMARGYGNSGVASAVKNVLLPFLTSIPGASARDVPISS